MGPEALREARRGMRLASELGLPLVTVIDTQGAALSAEAENGGLAGEIARCLSDLVTLDAPTLCLMLGEGNGGGALAFLPADRVIAAQHAWLSPLPPEGASAIVHRDLDHAPEMARAQQVPAPSTCTSAASSTGSSPSSPTPPTSPRRSASASAPCSSTSSPRCSARRRARRPTGLGATRSRPGQTRARLTASTTDGGDDVQRRRPRARPGSGAARRRCAGAAARRAPGSTRTRVQRHGVEALEEPGDVVGVLGGPGAHRGGADRDHRDARREPGEQQREAGAYGEHHARRSLAPALAARRPRRSRARPRAPRRRRPACRRPRRWPGSTCSGATAGRARPGG